MKTFALQIRYIKHIGAWPIYKPYFHRIGWKYFHVAVGKHGISISFSFDVEQS